MTSKTSYVRINAAERRSQALELRKAGCTFKQIGAAMGYTEQHAHQVVTEELTRLNKERAELASDVTRLELERLDALWMAQWKQAKAGHQGATQMCLRIMERRARILGLDANEKLDINQTGNIELRVVAPPDTFNAADND